MAVLGPCTQQDAHVSAYPMCICSAGRIGTSLSEVTSDLCAMSILVCRLWLGGDGVTVTQCNILAGQLVKHLQALRSAADDCTSPSQRAMKLSRFGGSD
mgnify:CR=1 FL=1